MKQLVSICLAAALLMSATACVWDGTGSTVPSSSSSPTAVHTRPVTAPPLPTTAPTAQPDTTDTVLLSDVPFIDQTRDYPTGCESVSTVMTLQYWGYSLSVDAFIDNYLPRGALPRLRGSIRIGCDPYEAFPGNPRTTKGYGCFAPVIYKAAQSIVSDRHQVADLTGTPLSALCETYIQNGIPVIVWATAGMQKPYLATAWQTPAGKTVQWISPNHCLVLTGYDDTYYYFNDPQKGTNIPYKRNACETAYNALGKQAIVIYPTPAPTTIPPVTTTVTIPFNE